MLGEVTWGGHEFMGPQSLKEVTPGSSSAEGWYLISPVPDCPVLLQGVWHIGKIQRWGSDLLYSYKRLQLLKSDLNAFQIMQPDALKT